MTTGRQQGGRRGPGDLPAARRPATSSTPTRSVDFVVSTGKPEIPLPDVVGQNKDDAADQLRSEGLRVVLTERDADDPKDQVVEMQPPAGHPGLRRGRR